MARNRRRRRPVPRKPDASKPVRPKRPAQAPKAPPVKPETPAAGQAAPAPVAPKPVAVKKAGAVAPQAPAVAKDPYIGRTIGRCRIEERIGLGKTAAVYRAHYEALDDKVAVKILTPKAASMPTLVERFHTEAKVIARLDNENVVKIYDVGTDGDANFMVMELLDGYSVLDLIEREDRVDPMDALRVARQTANGLAAAHAQNIIHRDIKPQNLLLLEDGTVKVLDFGLAAGFDDDTGERVGTPHYMAPEVCGDGSADLGTDIYALGIVLYHLLVGQPPYAGKDVKGILRAHLDGKPLRPERARPGTPKEIADLVRELTVPDPLMRPSAAEVVARLDAIGGESLKAKDTLRRRSRGTRARAAARKKSPVGPALAAGVVVVGLLVAVIAMSQGDDDGPDDGGGAATTTAGTGPAGTAPVPVAPSDPTDVEVDNPPVEPMESDAARIAREAREAEEADAREKAAREEDGKRALASAEAWAREHWSTSEDTKAVIDKYQSVYSRYKRTAAADEARARIKGIKDNSIHPHPDRSWSDASVVADAREQWRTAKPEMEALLAKHRYRDALAKLPPQVTDRGGGLAKELGFWREMLGDLRSFQRELGSAIGKLDDDTVLAIETPDGAGAARGSSGTKMGVLVDGNRKDYEWEQLESEQLFRLARRAFSGKPTKYRMYELAFAFAHRLQNPFWDVQLDLSGAPDSGEFQERAGDYERRFAERAGG